MSYHFSSLSFRLKSLTVLWLLAALCAIAFTLLLSWRMQGAGAAINDTGSLRMQTYRLALLHNNHASYDEINQQIQQFELTLATLKNGDPKRPLFLPHSQIIEENLRKIQQNWLLIKPHFLQPFQKNTQNIHNIQNLIHKIDDLTYAIEQSQSNHLNLLRLFQMSLLVMVLISAVVMVYLLNLWVLEPLGKLQTGVHAIHNGKFGVQVQVDNVSEFAELDDGFNQMSNHLQQLYSNLEQQVTEKTQDLKFKNQTLETLYYFSNFLNQAHNTSAACEGFLQKIISFVPAQASSIRLIDFKRQKLDLIAQIGLPENLQTAAACQRIDDCLCGQAVQKDGWQPIYFHKEIEQITDKTSCSHFGFHYLRVFQIRYKGQDLGMLTLYFHEELELGNLDNLIDSLCQQLGSAVNNLRLTEESRQLAVMQERNLMAQGLHDSIAQTLNFLNLQTQMLESSLKAKNDTEVAETLQFIKDGVKECYDDVRELLLNFRTKITRKEFAEAVDTLAQRFKQQTQNEIEIHWSGDGAPLSSEQQLQFIFILQESLSNIRKHAQANHVSIYFDNADDFTMKIHDNGRGFDVKILDSLSGSHVGLGIMRERALRIHAQFDLQSQSNHGTTIYLKLPKSERILE